LLKKVRDLGVPLLSINSVGISPQDNEKATRE
jgi:hypothetical protein